MAFSLNAANCLDKKIQPVTGRTSNTYAEIKFLWVNMAFEQQENKQTYLITGYTRRNFKVPIITKTPW